MPANRNALIRYKTIDNCLRNRMRKWTLDDLMEKISDALYEFEGIDSGISRRTVQADIQIMRSDKLGYEAPIIVVDKKYYTYEDSNYSITNTPISTTDLKRMNEAVDLLKQFKGFSHFDELNDVIQKLEEHVYSKKEHRQSVIDFEKNENLKGLSYLDILYKAIIQKTVLKITYQSFKAKESQQFFFHGWWLKEFKNRWFLIGMKREKEGILTLALDRILYVELIHDIKYKENTNYKPETYYKHVIGVTVSQHLRPQSVKLWFNNSNAPYVLTKPFHPSQKLMEQDEDGICISLMVQLNYELEKEIMGFGEGVKVLFPKNLKERIQKRLNNAINLYDELEDPIL